MTTKTQGSGSQPSSYEQQAWGDLINGQAKPTRRAAQAVSDGMTRAYDGVRQSDPAKRIGRFGTSVTKKIGEIVPQGAKDGAGKAADAAGRVVESIPVDWLTDGARAAGKSVVRVSRIGLTPERVVRTHQRKGHAVTAFHELRGLDLELIDRVRGRNTDLVYASIGAASGAGAALAMTGGEVGVGTGVGTVPGGAVVASAITADIAVLIGLASRAVGQVALAYGHDPEDPLEKTFVLSVVNFGTATSTAAKQAAFVDLVRLSQLLVRGAAWRVLEEQAIAKIARKIAERLAIRFTKKSLGKLIPVVGVGFGATMNFATLESVVDAANVAYRRRFLVDKYPFLLDDGDIDGVRGFGVAPDDSADDVVISVAEDLDLVEQEGDPSDGEVDGRSGLRTTDGVS
ncbi:EcsC protein family protein [Raineyella antarctica]|uniref:EcsC protein family protein n=1 Tax=Raineyella antarctica TaxID=1577474 RepID=A0A1G6I9X1_9ACTN|nr:EcsC family protein [Raineyella antarctica]SDC03332.1 EcsC protein family protein [Raineyella antarctica]